MQSAAGMMLVAAVYAFAAVPQLNRPPAGLPREIASSVRLHMPSGKNLGILDDSYHACWYYLEPSVTYYRSLLGCTDGEGHSASWVKANSGCLLPDGRAALHVEDLHCNVAK